MRTRPIRFLLSPNRHTDSFRVTSGVKLRNPGPAQRKRLGRVDRCFQPKAAALPSQAGAAVVSQPALSYTLLGAQRCCVNPAPPSRCSVVSRCTHSIAPASEPFEKRVGPASRASAPASERRERSGLRRGARESASGSPRRASCVRNRPRSSPLSRVPAARPRALPAPARRSEPVRRLGRFDRVGAGRAAIRDRARPGRSLAGFTGRASHTRDPFEVPARAGVCGCRPETSGTDDGCRARRGDRRLSTATERPVCRRRGGIAAQPSSGTHRRAHLLRPIRSDARGHGDRRPRVLDAGRPPHPGRTREWPRVPGTAIHAAQNGSGGPFVVLDCASHTDDALDRLLFGSPAGTNGHHCVSAGSLLIRQQAERFTCGTSPTAAAAATSPRTTAAGRRSLAGGKRSSHQPRRAAYRRRRARVRPRRGRGPVRDDLVRVLSIIGIDMPPLRQRREDIPAIARDLLRDICVLKQRPPLSLSRPAWRSSPPCPGTATSSSCGNCSRALSTAWRQRARSRSKTSCRGCT